MKMKRYLHKIVSILLIFLMIFQIVPKESLAGDFGFYVSYDSSGTNIISVIRDGEITAFGETMPNYYLEIDESVSEIYIKLDIQSDIYSFVLGNKYYVSATPNDWVKIDLTQTPLWKDGYIDIDESDSDRYRSLAVMDYENWANKLILIHLVSTTSGDTDKQNLANEISRVTSGSAINWHQANDRYNGEDYNPTGSFWADMQQFLFDAQNIYNNDSATQFQIDIAADNLAVAISKLIPASNVNATELYEEIIKIPQKPLMYDDYTQASWHEYYTAKSSAELLLNSLYDNGNPTDKNQSSDTNLLDEIEYERLNLKSVRELMDPLLEEDDTADVKVKYNAVRNLLRVYSPTSIDNSLYTLESYNNYLYQYDIAQEYIDNTPEPAGEVGKNQYDKLKELYINLWRGIHGLKDKKENITVTVKVIDTLGLRSGYILNECSGIHRIILSGNEKTIDAAIDSFNNEILSSYNDIYKYNNYIYATSINGILSTGGLNGRGIAPLKFRSPELRSSNLPEDYYDVQLHDNDVITLAFLDQPTVPSSSGTGQDGVSEDKFQEFYKQSSLLVDGSIPNGTIELSEGEELNLSAVYTLPHISTYSASKTTYKLSGISLFVSGLSANEDAITPANINTGIVSDENGNMIYGLYESGYYALSIHDLRANKLENKIVPGVTIGDTIYVHVSSATGEQLEKSRKDFKDKLQSLFNKYADNFFTKQDFVKINEFYSNGVEGIANAVDIKAIKEKYDTAFNGISAIHDKTIKENATVLSAFRALLSRLPNDVSLLGKSNEFLASELVKSHNAMTDYQKNQLTGIETNKYIGLKEAYEKGLPELAPYKLNIKVDANTEKAKTTIENMIEYLQANGENTDILYKFKVAERDIKENVTTGALSSTAYPDNHISFAATIDIFAYSLNSTLSGNGWMILDDDESFENVITKGKTVLIDGIPYEIKEINISGESILKHEDYKRGLLMFPNAQSSFIMPYSDVTLSVKWETVDENASPETDPVLALKKANTLSDLRNAFSQYRSNEYTEEAWVQMIAARDAGIAQIYAAKTETAIVEALTKAIADMQAIPKKPISGDIPNFGKKLGTVDVYVENTTFPGGAFTGNILALEAFPYAERDTMMTVILRALQLNGFGWTGQGGIDPKNPNDYTIKYIATITQDGQSMGEFSGEPGSGWMGTLNDFFVNEGFQEFSAANGKLSDGDEIRVMFTQNLGADIGGTWGNSDTSLRDLRISAGRLYPIFSSERYNYTLMMPYNNGKVKVTPTAANKNYLVKTFLNDKITNNKESASFYKRTQYIPVKSGDYISIGVGEYAWPSMNNQETETRNYTGTWYRLNIITPDNGASHVISLINSLPSISNIKLSVKDEIQNIRAIYNALTASEKSKVTNIQKLEDAEKKIIFFEQIEAVKELLRKIPTASRITLSDKTIVMAADTAYKLLTDEQKLYITVGDVKNYNDAIDVLTKLGAFNSGSGPSKITGSDAAPSTGGTIEVQVPTKVVNNEAISKVSEEQIKDAIEKAKKAKDVSSITVKAEVNEIVIKSTVTVPKNSLTDISIESMDLNIETALGTISLPEKALNEISKQSQGSSVEIVIENIASDKLNDEQKSITEGSTVYNISIISAGREISSFGGQKITISLPYELKDGQVKEKVSVWYMNDKGELEKISCTYDKKTGIASFTTDHLSYYAVGYDNSINFIDVKESDWFYKNVAYVTRRGLFSGTSEDTFSPNTAMTRAMLVTVLHRLDGKSVSAKSISFVDLVEGEFYIDAVNWSLEKEIVNGVTKTEFKPKNNVTREQLALMLYRYASSKNMVSDAVGSIEAFADKDKVSDWAKDAMKWAVGKGIITGKIDNKLDPTGNATRAEVAAMLQRYIENIK